VLSLRENKIKDLNRIKIGAKNDEFDMEGVNLYILDLSSNLFEEFPFNALYLQKRLKILDLSRNRIS
jgi:Leucine-rich repeat (LRR) protein